MSARRPDEPEIIGAAEAAEILGVSQSNLRVTKGLPEPYDRVRATTLYRRSEIEALAVRRRTCPQRGFLGVQANLQKSR